MVCGILVGSQTVVKAVVEKVPAILTMLPWNQAKPILAVAAVGLAIPGMMVAMVVRAS